MRLHVGVLVLLCVFASVRAQLEVLHEWVYLDYTWPSPETRREALDNGTYIPENNALAGVKVYNGAVYVTVPRWTPGVPSTLNKVVTVGNQTLLQPYPSWAMQQPDDCSAFQFTQSMEIDPDTGNMWVIDVGRRNIWGWAPGNASINTCRPKLVIIDLNTDEIVHMYEFPDDVLTRDGNFVNDIVIDPDGGYAYMTDAGTGPAPQLHAGGIIVYDMNTRSSHRLEHESMLVEPQYTNLTIGGTTYPTTTPVDGIALSPDKSLLHYCALAGRSVYQLPTSAARDPAVNLTLHVRRVGEKPSESDGLIMGHQRLYYGCLGGETCQSALGYWGYRERMNETGKDLDEITMGDNNYVIYYPRDDVIMTWPDTFTLDEEGYLWVVSNRLNQFSSGEMDFSGASGPNFRISKFPFFDDRSYLYKYQAPGGGTRVHCKGFILFVALAALII